MPRRAARRGVSALVALRADVDDVLGRLVSQLALHAMGVPSEQRPEWENRIEQVEQLRTWALDDLERMVGEAAREAIEL